MRSLECYFGDYFHRCFWIWDMKIMTLFFRSAYKVRQSCTYSIISLTWRHDGCDGVSSHQPHIVCSTVYFSTVFKAQIKETSKFRVTGLCAGISPGTGEFPAQMASNAENVSIWWRHHVCLQREAIHWVPCIRTDAYIKRYVCLQTIIHLCKKWFSVWISIYIITFLSVSFVMMTSSNKNISRVTGHLCGEFTGSRWIPRTKASDAELWCFLWTASQQMVE